MIYDVLSYDYEKVKNAKTQTPPRGNQHGRDGARYKDLICAFDIETTALEDVEQSLMYIWQFQIEDDTIIGRTWSEFQKFIRTLGDNLKDSERLCIFVHNLSYEFQYLRGVYDFKSEEVFAVKSRKVLKCMMGSKFEYRCSYLHTNMSLSLYLKKMQVAHQKLSGDEFDYKKKRYPWTVITKKELEYCINDVRGLVEALKKEMTVDGDNLYTFPLTSTGYVRRDAKVAMKKFNHEQLVEILPDYEVYTLLREAFRGGNTHANRFFAGKIVNNVKSADRSSSYPDCQCNDLFPMKKFQMEKDADIDDIIRLIYTRKKAVLFRLTLTNIKLKDPLWGAPYIPLDKCRNVLNYINDNGRILEAESLDITITDVDFRIIYSEYEWEDCTVGVTYSSTYSELPQPLKDVTIEYYRKKTELKGVKGKDILYFKSKNKLNSIYGMQAQNPVKQSIDFEFDDDFETKKFKERNDDECALLEKAYRKAFMSYAWGVWVTAWARYRLEEGISIVHHPERGQFFIYADTDSVKYVGDVDWSDYNNKRIQASLKSGAYASDQKGVKHYMGVYEPDGEYTRFKTLGAKKYAYEDAADGKLHVTIAGVQKEKGAAELEKHGGLESFCEGFIFKEAGGTEAVYNDIPYGMYTIDGRKVYITENLYIKESTYKLGISGEYERLLKNLPIL